MGEALSRQELEAAHCWEADDQVPRRPAMTGFRRRLRYHQARWRAANGHPIGSQPIAPRPNGGPARLVGATVPLEQAGAQDKISVLTDTNGDGVMDQKQVFADGALPDVELGADSMPMWEDGHRWVVLIRDGSEEHRVVEEFVPQGRLTAWVVDPERGSPVVLVLEESGTAGIRLRDFRHERERGYVATGGYDGSGRIVARLVEGEVPSTE